MAHLNDFLAPGSFARSQFDAQLCYIDQTCSGYIGIKETRMDKTLGNLIDDLRTEIEGIAVRGIRTITDEQCRWLKAIQKQIAETGAHFLADKIQSLIDAIDADELAAKRAYDLLTTLKVFERVLTLKQSGDQLEQMVASMEVG